MCEPNNGGYTTSQPLGADPQFAAYASTSPKNDDASKTVLLPGSSTDQVRYVLGPAGLTGSAIRSASAQLYHGLWEVKLELTSRGTAQWDELQQQQFHALIGIAFDGKVISASLTQPNEKSLVMSSGQMAFTSLSPLTEQQAKALAAQL